MKDKYQEQQELLTQKKYSSNKSMQENTKKV